MLKTLEPARQFLLRRARGNDAYTRIEWSRFGNLNWYWENKWYQLTHAGWLRSRKRCPDCPERYCNRSHKCGQNQYGIEKLTDIAQFAPRWDALVSRSGRDLAKEVPNER